MLYGIALRGSLFRNPNRINKSSVLRCCYATYTDHHHDRGTDGARSSAAEKKASLDVAPTMRAWRLQSYGGTEQLLLSDVPTPAMRNVSDVLVRVHAASINPLDIEMMGGYGASVIDILRGINAMSFSPPPALPLTLGRDFSGTVVRVGPEFPVPIPGMPEIEPGMEVYGVVDPGRQGSHAEYVVASSMMIHKKPPSLSHADAASFPYAAMTVWAGIFVYSDFWVLPIKEARTLVLGGNGGLGCIAVQALSAFGADVWSTCSPGALELVTSLGASKVAEYGDGWAERLAPPKDGFDVIMDCTGRTGELTNVEQYLPYLKTFGKFVSFRSPMLKEIDSKGFIGGILTSGLEFVKTNIGSAVDKGKTVRWAYFMPNLKALTEIYKLVEEGKIRPVVDKSFDFSLLPEAYDYMKTTGKRGKVTIEMIP